MSGSEAHGLKPSYVFSLLANEPFSAKECYSLRVFLAIGEVKGVFPEHRNRAVQSLLCLEKLEKGCFLICLECKL